MWSRFCVLNAGKMATHVPAQDPAIQHTHQTTNTLRSGNSPAVPNSQVTLQHADLRPGTKYRHKTTKKHFQISKIRITLSRVFKRNSLAVRLLLLCRVCPTQASQWYRVMPSCTCNAISSVCCFRLLFITVVTDVVVVNFEQWYIFLWSIMKPVVDIRT